MSSPPPPRGRRWRLNWLLRWGGLAVCVLVAGVYVGGLWWVLSLNILWLALFLFAAPTALAWLSELRRRRRECLNHCTKCGYDLAGLDVNAAGGCPECGCGRDGKSA